MYSNLSNEKKNEWIDFTHKNRVNPQKLYVHMKETQEYKVSDMSNIFIFDGKIYKQLSPREFKTIIKEKMPVEIRCKKDWEAVYDEFVTDSPDIFESDFNSDENIIGFQNGILNLSTGELMPHDEKYMLTRIIPCEYHQNQSLDNAPIFKNYITTLCSGNETEINFLLEYMGAIFSNIKGWRFKKFLILVGAGNTGKTQIRELTMDLLGRDYCMAIDMKTLNERFGSGYLDHKRLSGSGDMSAVELSEMALMKNLTGGDSTFAENKHKTGFTLKYDGFLWFNANELPHFRGDRGLHVYSRFAIIECNNIVPEEKRDSRLLEKLMLEKDIIVSVAIDMLRQAINRGYKFSESDAMIATRKQYAIENNSLLTFVNEYCDRDNYNHKTKRSEFNSIYKKWCCSNRLLPERDREISKQLFEHFLIEAFKTNGNYYYPLKIHDEVLKEYDSTAYAFNQIRLKSS